jgi:hypothetical protein
MRRLFVVFYLFLTAFVQAQELPSLPANGFSFPIGSRFTVKLHSIDSIHFDYSIVAFEAFEEIVDTWDNDHLFEEEGEEGTIEFFFCLGTRGKTEKEREENMQVLLIMKNRTKHALYYYSDIQMEVEGEFKETSNAGTFPGVKSMEMWPYAVYQIGLHDFRLR